MLAVSPENFREQIKFLRENFPILRFEKEWPPVKSPSVAITFDDGYADNVHEALPILEDLNVPATFFVSTGFMATNENFWCDRMESILFRQGEFPPHFTLEDPRYGRTWATDSPRRRNRLYESMISLMKRLDPQRRKDWINQLEKWSGSEMSDRDDCRIMNPEELKSLSASKWATVGAHTVTHSALSSMPEEQQRIEILHSKETLEKSTGTKVTTFSYPFGDRWDFNRTSVRLCRELGFVRAASNIPGQVHRWTDPFQIPRLLVRNWDGDTFAAKLKSFWTR